MQSSCSKAKSRSSNGMALTSLDASETRRRPRLSTPGRGVSRSTSRRPSSATPRNWASESSPCPASSSTRRPASLTSRVPSPTPPPRQRGFYTYDVKVAPARLVFKSLTKAPASPKAGKTFTVRMAATRSDTGAAIVNGQVDCTAKAGARSVQAEVRAVRGRPGGMRLHGPGGNERARRLRGTITIIFEGKKLTRPFSGKIG